MQSSLEKINIIIDKNKDKIEKFPLYINQGTKKAKKEYFEKQMNLRNELVEQLKVEYQNYSNELLNIIKDKYVKSIPEDSSYKADDLNSEIKLFSDVLKYTNKYNDCVDKINFTKIFYDFDDIDNNDLRDVINSLLYIINKLKQAGIILNVNDFNYSIYVNNFMKYFFDNINNNNLDGLVIDKFNEIYWSCPNLIKQLKLNLKILLPKYKKILEKYCDNKKQELLKKANTSETNCYNDLIDKKNQLNLLYKEDIFYITNRFLKNEINVDDYYLDSVKINKTINSFINTDFNSLSLNDKESFFKSIIELKNYIEEVENYSFFEPLLNNLKSRYLEGEKSKGLYETKLKEFNKLENLRTKMVKQKDKKSIFKKNVVVLEKKIEEIIEHLNQINLELDDMRINEKIYKYLNDGSTIYNGMEFINSFYDYMKKSVSNLYNIKENSELQIIMNKFTDFIYSPNNIIVKNIKLFSNFDMKELILNKCKLCNITMDDNFDNLKSELELIETFYYIHKNKIDLNKIKFLVETKKFF